MSKRSDDSIEQFFKKAVAQQDTSHLDSDWKNMEKMLDEHAISATVPKIRARKKIVTYTIVGALFISGMYLAVFRPWQSDSNSQLVSHTIQSSKPSQAAAGMLGPLSGTKGNPSADLLSSDTKTAAPTRDLAPTKEQIKTVHEAQSGEVNQPMESSLEDLLVKESQTENKDLQNSGLLPSETALPSSTTSVTSAPDILNTDAGTDETPGAAEISDHLVPESVLTKEEMLVATDTVDQEEEEKKKSANVPSRWSVALTVAPDFSSTRVGRYSAPGTAYGLFVSYRPLPRWQLSTGLIKSAKQYEGYGEEYQPPAGYWENRTNGIVPDEVEGSCGIIEWPLILRFDFITKPNARFYVTSGVSSYLMRTESYKYKFAQDNPGAASGWSSTGATSYAFSIGHLSAGYERSFSNRIAVAIEPYFKVPFNAIGWSNIDLHTTGAYLTVRYTFANNSIVTTHK